MVWCGLCRVEGRNRRNCPKGRFAKSNGLVDEDDNGDLDEYNEANAWDDDDEVVSFCLLNYYSNFWFLC